MTRELERAGEKWSITDLMVILMLTFVVTTAFQSVFDRLAANRVIGAMLAGLALWQCARRMRMGHLVMLFSFATGLVMAFYQTVDSSAEIREWIYYMATLLMLFVLSEPENLGEMYASIRRQKGIIPLLIHLICLLILGMLTLKIGYETKWGQGTYFVGLCNEAHTMASLCCMLMSLILFYISTEPCPKLWYGLLSLIPLMAVFQTGARTFLIPAAILLVMILNTCVKSRWIRAFFYLAAATVFAYLVFQSSMGSKFQYALDTRYSDSLLDAFTSGRTRIWKEDLEAYALGNGMQLLFGNSFSQIYRVNLRTCGLNIGAHNDLIGLLNGTGLIGTLLYLYAVLRLFRALNRHLSRRGERLLCKAYVVLPMLLNGFYTYQHYVYSFVFLFLLLGFGRASYPDRSPEAAQALCYENTEDERNERL